MFKLNKHKSARSAERFSFNFSSFLAVQVPKGWDKLSISVVSLQTGKSIAKLGKASVRNGNCRWAETLTESLPLSQVEGSAKEFEECSIKFIIAMGASRSGILGEANVNLARYTNSKALVPLSLPLSKCDYGTILQLKVQCLTPKSRLREEQKPNTKLHGESTGEYDEIETKSDLSGNALSSSSNLAESRSQSGISREPSLSESGSRHSFDSVDGSSGRDGFSPQSKFNGIPNPQIGRQDSADSQNSTASLGFHSLDDGNRSNNMPMSSKALSSASPHRNEREQSGQNSGVVFSPFHDGGSSKDLMEAAEVKVGELHAEARIWERNAKRSMLDMEAIKQELFEQSKRGETLEIELSASQTECDSLKHEITELKSMLEEARTQLQDADDRKLQDKDAVRMRVELEDEIRFHKESNADLAEQLQKTQDSNVELLSILQELEGIIETQKAEIDNLSAEKHKLEGRNYENSSDTEICEQNNLQVQLQELLQTQEKLESNIQVLETTLEQKMREAEMEQGRKVQALLDCESKWKSVLATKEEEISSLQLKLSQSNSSQRCREHDSEDGQDSDLAREVESLKTKLVELESDCNELVEENLELALKLKEASKDLVASDGHDVIPASLSDGPSNQSVPESNQPGSSFPELQEEQLRKNSFTDGGIFSSQPAQTKELENKCSELEIQLQTYKDKALHLEDECHKCQAQIEELLEAQALRQSAQGTNSENIFLLSSDDISSAFSVLHEQLHRFLASMNKHWHTPNSQEYLESIGFVGDLSMMYVEPDIEEQHIGVILKYLHQLGQLFKALGDRQELENDELKKEDDRVSQQVLSELTQNNTQVLEIEVLRSECLMKEEEIRKLLHKQMELENVIMNIQKELDENKANTKAEKSSSEESDSTSNELMLLNSSMESQAVANRLLERKSSELEKGKEELELHLSELEGENMQLSERISALEAQLRYLTDEKESCRLQLQHSDCEVVNLHDEIKRMEGEIEIQKAEMKQKLQDIQKRWLDAQEECEYLKKANLKLQVTIENLIEECNTLQKLSTDLKLQNTDLHSQNIILEAQVMTSHERFSNFSFKIESLEAEVSSMLEEIALKENSLISEIQCLIHENQVQKEKLINENRLLNQKYSDKALEAENIQKELVHFIDQISASDGDSEKLTSEAMYELSSLRAEKSKLETALSELEGKFASSERKLNKLQTDSEAKIQELVTEISSSRQKQEVLLADKEKLCATLDSVKISEEKCKSILHNLKIKLSASEYEKLQQSEEIAILREQLQKSVQFQDEVVTVQNSLAEAKFENERLRASFDMLSGDHEQLESEKVSLVQKISIAEKATTALEECRRDKIALEEKVLRLEGDLGAREALCAQDAELKLELSRVKRTNNELQRKIKHLKEDKEDCLKKANLSASSNSNTEQVSDAESEAKMTDFVVRIHSLENELAEAMETNDMYKSQLKRFLSDPSSSPPDTPTLSENQSAANTKDPQHIIQSLQTELKDLRERYFQMSLKYAEVEAQREELVLKLKSTGNRRSWFS